MRVWWIAGALVALAACSNNSGYSDRTAMRGGSAGGSVVPSATGTVGAMTNPGSALTPGAPGASGAVTPGVTGAVAATAPSAPPATAFPPES